MYWAIEWKLYDGLMAVGVSVRCTTASGLRSATNGATIPSRGLLTLTQRDLRYSQVFIARNSRRRCTDSADYGNKYSALSSF